ncbi:MAG: hypothetical protein JW757_02215 [Anaerolineales bacterium]|nr:hypothetical protein [Anaerolineales bacterium]
MSDGRMRKTAFRLLTVVLLAGMVFSGKVLAAESEYDCSAQTAIPEDQCLALLAIYDATGGENWTVNTNWLGTNDPCSWHGVACVNGTIVSLDLYNNNLVGELPLEIGAFPDLETLTINNNPLTGSVPLTITFLDLRLFHFHNTGLCEPADPTFQDWLLGVVYRFSNGVYCTPLPTATLPQSGPTQVQPTSDQPWPQQTLTAMAQIATEQASEPTPTKYYTLKSPTPVPTDTPPAVVSEDRQSPGENPADVVQDNPVSGFLGGIPKNWLYLLLIPVALIVVGLLLELRERRKEAEPFEGGDEVSDALFQLDYVEPNDDN